jgi:hypothetical protein
MVPIIVADYLHVGRGADLIFYLALLAGLFVVSNFYLRFKRHEQALIALARQSAIDHAHGGLGASKAESRSEGDRTIEEIQ